MGTARNWKDVRAELKADGAFNPDEMARIRQQSLAEIRAHRLAEIRKSQDLSQQAVAEAMQISQARVSTIERGELPRTEVGTLQAYIEALGGRLKLVAEFGDESLIVG